MNLAGVLLFIALVLMFVAIGYAAAYHELRKTSNQVAGQRDHLVGVGVLLREVLGEINAIWGRESEQADDLASLAKEVAQVLPMIYKGLSPAAMSAGAHRHKLTADDFAAASQGEAFKRIERLVAVLGIEEISIAWRSRRVADLVAMLRAVHGHLERKAAREREQHASPPKENEVLLLLRNKAGAHEIAEEVERQIAEIAERMGRPDGDAARGVQALRAVLEVLCARRDHQSKALTLGVLLQAVGPGVEILFREVEGNTGAEAPDSARKALRAYVEGLPGWDGRMPFNDVTRASHNAYMSSVKRVLMMAS